MAMTNPLLDTLGRRNRKHADKNCHECGSLFRPKRSDSKYCSRPCLWANNGGQNKQPQTWWTNAKGYIEGRVWLPDGTCRSVKQHRYIMEQHLERPLEPWEDVHHKDGNKQNNDLSNLEVLEHGIHASLSNRYRFAKAEGRA